MMVDPGMMSNCDPTTVYMDHEDSPAAGTMVVITAAPTMSVAVAPARPGDDHEPLARRFGDVTENMLATLRVPGTAIESQVLGRYVGNCVMDVTFD
jgi:hypothetical protein